MLGYITVHLHDNRKAFHVYFWSFMWTWQHCQNNLHKSIFCWWKYFAKHKTRSSLVINDWRSCHTGHGWLTVSNFSKFRTFSLYRCKSSSDFDFSSWHMDDCAPWWLTADWSCHLIADPRSVTRPSHKTLQVDDFSTGAALVWFWWVTTWWCHLITTLHQAYHYMPIHYICHDPASWQPQFCSRIMTAPMCLYETHGIVLDMPCFLVSSDPTPSFPRLASGQCFIPHLPLVIIPC